MVLGSGCFDGIHSGHARYFSALKQLRAYDEQAWVAVAPDEYIYQHKRRRTRWLQSERARAVSECGVEVETQTELSVAETIRRLRPRLFVKGLDWAGKLPADVQAACQEVGALMVFVDCPGTHTSEVDA